MNNNIEHIQHEFNNRARSVFFALYNGFRNSVSSLDRQRDENVFQQQQGKYISMLKQQLEAIAQELISKNKMPQNTGQLNESLPFLILNYTTEFARKIKSL